MPVALPQDSQGRWIYPVVYELSALCSASDYRSLPIKSDECTGVCDPLACPDCKMEALYKHPLSLGDPLFLQSRFPDFFNDNPQQPEIGWNDGSGGSYWLDLRLLDIDGNPFATGAYNIANEYMHGWGPKGSYQNIYIDTSDPAFIALLGGRLCFYIEAIVCIPFLPTYGTADYCAESFAALPDGDTIGDLAVVETVASVSVYQWNGAAWIAFTGPPTLVYCPSFNLFVSYDGMDWNPENPPSIAFEFDELCCDIEGSYWEPFKGLETEGADMEYMVYDGVLYQYDGGTEAWVEVVTLADGTIICFPEANVIWVDDETKISTRLPEECYTCNSSQSCLYGPYEIINTCNNTVTVEGVFDGYDCQGLYYGLPKQLQYVGSSRFNYRNFKRLRGLIETDAYPREVEDSDNGVRLSTTLLESALLRTWGLTKEVAFHVANIMMADPGRIFIDDESWDDAEEVAKNNDDSTLWWLNIRMERELCTKGETCDDAQRLDEITQADPDIVIVPPPKTPK